MSTSLCSYCNSLKKAITNENYCSVKGDQMHEARSNAFYYKTSTLISSKHTSRLSIRSIFYGYQNFYVGNDVHVLDKSNYLIINEGEEFHSEIRTNKPTEGLVVAINKNEYNDLQHYHNYTDAKLLENPFEMNQSFLTFETQKIETRTDILKATNDLKHSISNGYSNRLYYQEKIHDLFEKVIFDQAAINNRMAKLSALKTSTKTEITRRLRLAQNYIDSHLHKKISLEELGQVSLMSPFHFLRCFKKYFSKTPIEYLTQQRINRTKFLLLDSRHSIGEITLLVGFQSPSSLGRVFKKLEGISPLTYRQNAIS